MRQHGVRALTDRDRELLRLIGEQYLVTLPQLAYLAGRSERTARWLRTRWQRARLVDAQPLFAEEATFVWLTQRGLNTVGLPWRSVRPSLGWAQTAATVVDVRLAVCEQYPAVRWLSRRALAHAAPRPSPVPDALLVHGEHRIAVVVKRLRHRDELDRLLEPLAHDYAHVIVVLPEERPRLVERIVDQVWPATLVVHARQPRVVAPPTLPALAETAVGRCGGVAIAPHGATPFHSRAGPRPGSLLSRLRSTDDEGGVWCAGLHLHTDLDR